MSRYLPSFILLVPGPWRHAEELIDALAGSGIAATVTSAAPPEVGSVEVDIVEDHALGASVGAAALGQLAPALLATLEQTTRAALVEVGGRLDEDSLALARLGRALAAAGGLAVRMERSGQTLSWERWLSRVQDGLPRSLLEVGMALGRDENGTIFTCGMHHFDLPDAQVTVEREQDAAHWLESFGLFQLLESPNLTSGHTFRPDEGSAPRVVERWPDHRHGPGDGRHNPFGMWRALAPGQAGLEPLALVPTYMPSLAALLVASERRAGRPLLREQVEQLAENATAIAMGLPEVKALERSRGYADIEPRLAWEQWQIVRSH